MLLSILLPFYFRRNVLAPLQNAQKPIFQAINLRKMVVVPFPIDNSVLVPSV
jgi:hypothetical protein